MKISSRSPIASKTVGRSDAKSTQRSGAAFKLDAAEENAKLSSAGAATPVGPIASLDALLALQGTDDSTTGGRSKGLKLAHDMLDILEGLRRAILLGAVSPQDLRRLADLSRNRQGAGDAKLDEILQEVELRAEVELAKYGF